MVHTTRPRVLVVAYDFPPHAAIGTMRTLRVVRQLDARGWDVTVLTADPDSDLPQTPVDPALLSQVPSSVRVIRAGALRGWSRTEQMLRQPLRRFRGSRPESRQLEPAVPGDTGDAGSPAWPLAMVARMKDVVDATLSIPDRQVGWMLPALSKAALHRLRTAPPDVIYSSAPPWTGQLVAAGLHAMLKRPWVADFRDPWSRAPWRGDKYRFEMRAAAVLERHVIRRADHILFVAQANRDDFASHYGPEIGAKLHVVPNGCDPSEFDSIERPHVDPNDTFVLLHAGSLYAGRTPMPVIRAVAEAARRGIIDPDRFRLRFLGQVGAFDVRDAARQLGIERVIEVIARVPRQQSLTAIASAHALLLLQPGHTVSVPGKLYEYLAAGRPILAIAEESETAEIVRSSGIGVSVRPDDEARIVDALASVIAMAKTDVPRPARELFDGMSRAAETVDILEAVVRGEHVPLRRRSDLGLPMTPAPHASRPGQ